MPISERPPQLGTFKRYGWELTRGLQYWRARFGSRLLGGVVTIFADAIMEAFDQAVFARLPGHPQQAPDSLVASGRDRDLYRFRGETMTNWIRRVRDAWTDYEQGGTPQQMLKVINQWGVAGWPTTWDDALVTLTESADPAVFTFELTIGYGAIIPPWVPWTWGSGHVWGETALYWGVGPSTDLLMLLYLVRKWKPSRSRGFVTVYWSATDSVTFTV
jgi:hypothetical protein